MQATGFVRSGWLRMSDSLIANIASWGLVASKHTDTRTFKGIDNLLLTENGVTAIDTTGSSRGLTLRCLVST